MKIKIIIFALLIIFVGGLVYFSVFTTRGASVIFRSALSRIVAQEGISIKNEQGSLFKGVTFDNIELKEIKDLPLGSQIRVQRFFIKLSLFNAKLVIVHVENARVLLPHSDPILLSGTLNYQDLNVNIFSKGFSIDEVLSYLPDFKALIPITGELNEVDLTIKGAYFEPLIDGQFTIQKFVYKGFTLTDSLWNLELQLKELKKDIQLFGDVNILNGELLSNKTKIKIGKGRIHFDKLLNDPTFNFQATSRIDRTNISISLKGNLSKPQLDLSSQPSYSKEKLMIMLATGKIWKNTEAAMATGEMSLDITSDFIDYFFFAGKTNKFAEKLGIRDIAVKYDDNTKGISAKKAFGEKLDVGYGVEVQENELQDKTIKQKIQGEYQMTDELSVGVEHEMSNTQSLDALDPQQEVVNDDTIYMQYKKSF